MAITDNCQITGAHCVWFSWTGGTYLSFPEYWAWRAGQTRLKMPPQAWRWVWVYLRRVQKEQNISSISETLLLYFHLRLTLSQILEHKPIWPINS